MNQPSDRSSISAPTLCPASPILASTLLALETEREKRRPNSLNTGVKSLDEELVGIWEYGSVVGVRGDGGGVDEVFFHSFIHFMLHISSH
jgi:hypothetical protein